MGTNMLFMNSWKGVEAALDALPSSTTACLKGPGLQEVCAAVERLAPIQPPTDAVVIRMRCFVKYMQLLAKLLAARRRARDWKQQDFSSKVVAALAAATAVLRCPGIQRPQLAAKLSTKLLADTDLLALVAAAQQEITQLLSTQHSQKHGDQQQKQQRQQQQGNVLLLEVAHQLLLWWVEAQQLWQHNPGRASLASATTAAAAEGYFAHHVQAVELAAAVAQSAGHSCTPEQFLVLAQVEQMLSGQDRSQPFSTVAREAVTAHYSTAAYLQLSLTLLLLHTYLAGPAAPISPAAAPFFKCVGQAAAMPGAHASCSAGCSIGGSSGSGSGSSGSGSGSSGSGSGSRGSGSGSSGPSSSGGSSGSSGASSSGGSGCCSGNNLVSSSSASAAAAADADTSAAAGGADAMLAPAREQHWQKLHGNVTGMWQLLGLQPAALPVFADAILADDRVLKGILNASCGTLQPNISKPLPKNRSPMLQVRYRRMAELSGALFTVMRPPSMNAGEWCAEGLRVSLDAHSRQQQQLLQAVCWPLPELLLRTALLCGEGEPLINKVAVTTAIYAMSYWHAPGMEAAAAAAKPQQLPALLDCWLQLMQQLLLQPQQQPGSASLQQQQQQQQPLGLLMQLAATARVLPSSSTAAQQLMGAGWCSCDTVEDDPMGAFSPEKHISSSSHSGSSNSGSISCVCLPCDSLAFVGGLLDCLGAMKVSPICLTPRAGSVMLLLEVLARRVLAHHITCNNSTSSTNSTSSSSSSTGSSSSGSSGDGSTSSQRSSSAARLWQQLRQVLGGGDANGAHGILPALFGIAAAERPQLQPKLLALLASLHKLSRQQSTRSQVCLSGAAAWYASFVIHKLSDAGVPRLVDLRTWRAMIAPWVLLIGLYCCELGRWLQRWQREQLHALQDPDSSIRSSRKAAHTALEQFNRVNFAADEVLGYPALKLVAELWESGTSDSTSYSRSRPAEVWDSNLTGAEFVHRWQQWQHSAAAAGGQQQQQQQQQPAAATAAAGMQGSAATAAASQQSMAVPTSKQQPPLPPLQQQQPPQQQQQVLVPAFGSLEEEFPLINGEITTYFEFTWSVSHATQKHLKRLKCSTLPEPRGSQQGSSSGSSTSSISDTDESSGKDDSSGDDDSSSSEDEERSWEQVRDATKRKVRRASTIHSCMQACLAYEGFDELAELLQGVGEAMCAKLPVPWMCNNPGCTCMSGASELQLVGGKACVCGGCGVARYCGTSCQAAHWQQHKPVCRELAAWAAADAAAAAAAGSGAGSSGGGSSAGATAHIVL